MSDLTVVNQPNSVALGEGFGSLGPIPIANMVLVQKSTKLGTPGKFRDQLTGAEFDSLIVCPLSCQKTRVLFPENEIGADPLCKSFDGLFPISAELLGHPPISDKCDGCPESSWAGYDNKTKTGDKPRCKEQRRLLFVERESGLPYRLTLGGMNLKPLKDILNALQRDAIAAGMKGDIRNIYDYAFSMTPQRIDGKRGTFYVITFGVPTVMKETERGRFGPLYQKFVKDVEKFREVIAQENEPDESVQY